MHEKIQLTSLNQQRVPSITDQVFEEMYRQVVELSLPPGTKISEADVARQLGVSRQPVRDAFYRLSQLGFLTIRPQRATRISHISEEGVIQACFVRTALEVEVFRVAAHCLTDQNAEALNSLIEEQRQAIDGKDKKLFHSLDDKFHQLICDISGRGFVWNIIADHKAQMDRVRYLTLSFGAENALSDHIEIVDALTRGDSDHAATVLRQHLSRVAEVIEKIRLSHQDYFVPYSQAG